MHLNGYEVASPCSSRGALIRPQFLIQFLAPPHEGFSEPLPLLAIPAPRPMHGHGRCACSAASGWEALPSLIQHRPNEKRPCCSPRKRRRVQPRGLPVRRSTSLAAQGSRLALAATGHCQSADSALCGLCACWGPCAAEITSVAGSAGSAATPQR